MVLFNRVSGENTMFDLTSLSGLTGLAGPLQGLFNAFLAFLIGLFSILAGTGCIATSHGTGEVGFKQSTTWSFYVDNEKDDKGVEASAASVSSTLVDELLDEEPNPGTDVE